MLNESFINEMHCNEDAVISGEEIANMVGMGDAYRQGKQEVEHDNQMIESCRGKFNTIMERMDKVVKNNRKEIFD